MVRLSPPAVTRPGSHLSTLAALTALATLLGAPPARGQVLIWITPSEGTWAAGTQVSVTIEYCALSGSFDAPGGVQFNGVDVTASFSYGGSGVECPGWGTDWHTRQGTVTLVQGQNTLLAYGYTEFDYGEQTASYTGSAPPPVYGVAVTPDGATAPARPANTTGHSASFTVQNTGNTLTTYSVSCATSGPVTCTGVSHASVQLGAGATQSVTAYYNVGAPGSGTLTLTASGSGVSDQGSYAVPVATYGVAVTPDGATAPARAANTGGHTASFTVSNSGGLAATFTVSCGASASVTCTGVNPSSVQLNAGQSQSVTATYGVGTVGSGTLTVTASGSGVSDQGSYTVPVVVYLAVLDPEESVGHERLTGMPGAAEFTVRNVGSGSDTYSLQCQPILVEPKLACVGVQPASITLAPGADASFTVSYSGTSNTGTGVLFVRALGQDTAEAEHYAVVEPEPVLPAGDVAVVVWPGSRTIVGSPTIDVVIEWCGRDYGSGNFHAFPVDSLRIRHNAQDVTAQFTHVAGVAPPDCQPGQQADETYFRSTGTVTLVSGTNELRGDVIDFHGHGGSALATLEYVSAGSPPYHAVSVTAASQAVMVPPSTQRAVAFAVSPGASYTATCTGAAAAGSCTATAGGGDTVNVSFTSGATLGSTGLVMLTAYTSTARDSSWTEITVQAAPAAGVALVGSGAVVERDLCLTIAAGDGAASECGDLRLVHPLPPTRTLNRPWAPVLLYNSQHASPTPIVAVDVTLPTGATDTVRARLLVAGNEHGKGYWAAWAPNTTRRIAVRDTTGVLADGIHTYTLEVMRKSGGGWTALATPTGQLPVVRRDQSPFGAGWWLAGLERLDVATMTWTGGDGSVRQYAPAGTNCWVAPNVDHPDTLKLVGSHYVRVLPDSLRVKFDAATGRHGQTVNRLNQITVFGYDACGRLSTIKLPPDTTSRIYTFTYATAPPDCTGRLATVSAPPIGSVPRVTTLTVTGGRVTAITDPDTTTVAFGYETGTNRVTSRTDRRQKVTTYTYDIGKRVSSYLLPVWTTPVTLVPAETRGLAQLGAAVPLDSAYTLLDGPRTDVADVTKFWANGYGAPTRIRNAVGRETLITYDAMWPGLVARTVAPNRMISRASYNVRGLPDSTVVENPLGDGRNAKTTYAWHAQWFKPTLITSPMGVTTGFGYDPSTGNRSWQQPGSDPARRVTFGYDPSTGWLATVTVPGLSGSESLYYDALGNVRKVQSPMGFLTLVYSDAVGRDTMVVSAINPATAGNEDSVRNTGSRVRTVYDIAGRVRETVSWGPGVVVPPMSEQLPAESVSVVHEYDDEGNVRLTHRRLREGEYWFVLTSSWEYDDANRVVWEQPQEGPTIYVLDPAGNRTAVRSPRGHVVRMEYDGLNRLVRRIVPRVREAATPCWGFPGIDPIYEWGTCMWSFPTRDGPDVCLRADTAVLSYDQMGNLSRADTWAALVRRGYTPSGLLARDTLRIRTYYGAVANPCEPVPPAGQPRPYPGTEYDVHAYGLRVAYDLDGRRDTLYHPDGIDVCTGACRERFVYQPGTGWLDRMFNVQDSLFQFGYDDAGRLIQVRSPGGASGIVETRDYDDDGRLSARSLPLPSALVSDALSRDARGKVLSGTAWDPVTNSSVAIQLTYAGLGAVVFGENLTSGETWEGFRADELGNRLWHRSWAVASPNVNRCRALEYDYLRRLVKISEDSLTAGCLTAVAYDYVHHTAYDPAGNVGRTGMHEQIQGGGRWEQAVSYYGADNQLRVFNRHAGPGPTSNAGGVYEEYRYDALGRRVLVRSRCTDDPGSSPCRSYIERTVWDGAQVLYEIRAPGGDPAVVGDLENDAAMGDASTFGRYGRVGYTHAGGIDQPLAVFRVNLAVGSPQLYTVVPHADWRGTYAVGTFMDGTTAPEWLIPFPGGRTTVDGELSQAPNPTWWGSLIGAQTDGSKLEYKRNRYYDPHTGRFTQEDPIGLAGGLNLYGFAEGDPVNLDDPFGLCPPELTGRPCGNVLYGSSLKIRTSRGNPLVGRFGMTRFNDDGTARAHHGTDYLASVGSATTAADQGEVAFAGLNGDYGLQVVVAHRNAKGEVVSWTSYSHLSKLGVKVGQSVEPGDVVGLTGQSGNARRTTPHLHFEILTQRPARRGEAGLEDRVSPQKVVP